MEHSSHHHKLWQVHSGAVDLSSTRIQDIYVLLTATTANETAFKGSEDPISSGNMLPRALELP